MKNTPDDELRKRLDFVEMELKQLAHDEEHVNLECIGMELFYHLKKIDSERRQAELLKHEILSELSSRSA